MHVKTSLYKPKIYMMTKLITCSSILFVAITMTSMHKTNGQQLKNIIAYNDSIGSPKANLDAIKWIAGSWKGEALGGITEEVWTPPLGGSMMCIFKLVVNNKVKFYEFVTITEKKGTLLLQIKHFNSDLVGWEKKDETVDFKLVKVTPDKIYFDEFTFEKVSDTEINMYVVFKQKSKKVLATFNYKKVKT